MFLREDPAKPQTFYVTVLVGILPHLLQPSYLSPDGNHVTNFRMTDGQVDFFKKNFIGGWLTYKVVLASGYSKEIELDT